MHGRQKKLVFFYSGRWTSILLWVILNALFAPEAWLLGGDTGAPEAGVTAKVRLADPEGENRLAELEAENRRLKHETAAQEREIAALRKELIETLERYSSQAARLGQLELSAAGTLESLEPVLAGSREKELAEALKQVSDSGRRFAGKALELHDALTPLLDSPPADKVERARMALKLDSLKEDASRLASLTSPPVPPGRFEICRILAIDDASRAAILSAGFKDGVRDGLLLRSGNGGKVLLKVIAVRLSVSAAMLLEGDMKDLSPGMEATTRSARK